MKLQKIYALTSVTHTALELKRGEEQNREEGEIGGKSREEGEKEKLTFTEEGEIGSKSREKGDLPPPPPCSTPLIEVFPFFFAGFVDGHFQKVSLNTL